MAALLWFPYGRRNSGTQSEDQQDQEDNENEDEDEENPFSPRTKRSVTVKESRKALAVLW